MIILDDTQILFGNVQKMPKRSQFRSYKVSDSNYFKLLYIINFHQKKMKDVISTKDRIDNFIENCKRFNVITDNSEDEWDKIFISFHSNEKLTEQKKIMKRIKQNCPHNLRERELQNAYKKNYDL